MPVDCIAACYCQEWSGNRMILIRKFALRQKDNTFERNSGTSWNKQLHYYVAVSYKAGMNALTQLPTYFIIFFFLWCEMSKGKCLALSEMSLGPILFDLSHIFMCFQVFNNKSGFWLFGNGFSTARIRRVCELAWPTIPCSRARTHGQSRSESAGKITTYWQNDRSSGDILKVNVLCTCKPQ